jgi:hypothetical protein
METMTSSWTDDRMDDLKRQVDQMSRRTDEARLDAMNERFDAMQRVLIMFGAAMFAAMTGLIATQLGLILIDH